MIVWFSFNLYVLFEVALLLQYVCPWCSSLTFLITKTFSNLELNILQNVSSISNSHMMTNFKFKTFFIIFNFQVKIHVLTSIGFILIVWWYALLYSLTISSNLSICIFYGIEGTYFGILLLNVLSNLSTITDFPSLCTEYFFISLSTNHGFTIIKVTTFIQPYFVLFISTLL